MKGYAVMKTIRTVLMVFFLVACGGSDASGTEKPHTVIQGVDISTWMYQIQDLYGEKIQALDKTPYDMLVIEPGFNLKEDPYDTAGMVSTLSTKPNGEKRLLIAYIDIGQAEDYRDYWKENWVAPTGTAHGSPDFLITTDPDGWSGNYPVAYWDARWKAIWLGEGGIIDTLVAKGFDGVYLDWVEAYDDEKVLAYASKESIDTKKEMITFIEELKARGEKTHPGFTVIAQNAPYLLEYDPKRYSAVIDAIATEDTWYYGKADADWEDKDAGDLVGDERQEDEYSTPNRIKQNLKYLTRGIPVFTVDYCISTTNAAAVYTASRHKGFIPLVTRVSLSRVTQTPPPEFK
jgi:cysteinyl-tRNA synthetase